MSGHKEFTAIAEPEHDPVPWEDYRRVSDMLVDLLYGLAEDPEFHCECIRRSRVEDAIKVAEQRGIDCVNLKQLLECEGS